MFLKLRTCVDMYMKCQSVYIHTCVRVICVILRWITSAYKDSSLLHSLCLWFAFSVRHSDKSTLEILLSRFSFMFYYINKDIGIYSFS